MKQLLILSGKGGTGKTTVASAFIKLSQAKTYADCDVDAPNLHLAINHQSKFHMTDFFGMHKAHIDNERCSNCGICKATCRFDAISFDDGYHINAYNCEGCGVCEMICAQHAITLSPNIAGSLILHKNEVVFSTAKLKMGSGNSGKLVSKVKKRMCNAAIDSDLAIIDGSPGIGCPVIASISGVDMALIVTEPSLSGISDLKRIVETAKSFDVKMAVCINKFDINIVKTQMIIDYCKNNNLPMVENIPFDLKAIDAINDNKTIVDIECQSGNAVKQTFIQAKEILYS
jgi:MinD superfamily P-loop ATPase